METSDWFQEQRLLSMEGQGAADSGQGHGGDQRHSSRWGNLSGIKLEKN